MCNAAIPNDPNDASLGGDASPRVLLVEDDPMVARAVIRALRAHSLEVVHAAAARAVSELTGPFEVGIFDIDLPDANGTHLAEWCSAQRLVGQVVFFSATQSAQQITAARVLGELIEKSEGIARLLDHVLPACGRPSGIYAKPGCG